MNAFPSEARQPGARESAGLATSDERLFADGRKVGEVSYRFGPRDTVTRDMPGWYVADGTQPIDLVVAGVNYGKPDLTNRFILGAVDGVPGFDIGDTGGSGALAAHTHSFTQPTAHGITQPVVADHGTISHSSNHTVTQPDTHGVVEPEFASHATHAAHAQHASHVGTAIEVLGTPGTNVWVNGFATAATSNAAYAHAAHDNNHAAHDNNHTRSVDVQLTNNHSGTAVAAHGDHTVTAHTLSTNVALTNNHSGGAVGAISGAAPTQVPPFIAVWPLLKLR